MAVDMFIQMMGIDGESKDDTYKQAKDGFGVGIDVLAWSWGMSQSGTFHHGGGGGSGKVNVQDLSFTKYVDKSSAALLKHCCNGAHIDKCKLTVRKAGEAPLEYLIIEMTKCMVTAVSTGGSGGEDRLTENVTLNFAIVHVDYKEQLDDGSGQQAGNMGWDIEANIEA